MVQRIFSLLMILTAIFSISPARAADVLAVADKVARSGLTYVYGSEDPKSGGLDCSGFTRLVFHEACGIDLPGEADKQLVYIQQHGGTVWDANSGWKPELAQPGDFIFYSGPIPLPRTSQISHVMLYAGNGLVVGSQGKGHQINGTFGGVGYYAYKLPPPMGHLGTSGMEFIGHRRVFAYARLPAAIGSVVAPQLVAKPIAPLAPLSSIFHSTWPISDGRSVNSLP